MVQKQCEKRGKVNALQMFQENMFPSKIKMSISHKSLRRESNTSTACLPDEGPVRATRAAV